MDLELFAEIHRIEDALRKQSCTEALAWCNENKNALKKIKVSCYLTSPKTRSHSGVPEYPRIRTKIARIHRVGSMYEPHRSNSLFEETSCTLEGDAPRANPEVFCVACCASYNDLWPL